MVPVKDSRRWLLLGLTLLVALSRLLAASKSIWDWDEGLFCLALRDYNVVLHHPHPPGFPLFIAAAKLVRLVVRDDFHALRAVSLIASMLVFPAMVALARCPGPNRLARQLIPNSRAMGPFTMVSTAALP